MKVCRLKIITGNIIDETDTPQIHYVSQNKISKIITNNNNNEDNNFIHNIDDKILQNEYLEKITEDKSQYQPKDTINYLENQNTTKIKVNENELNNNNNNMDINIDINDLCTISNTKIIEDHKIDNILNYIDKNFPIDNNLNNNYPYEIMNKKKGLNNSLRYLFKNRETRTKNNKNTNESSYKSLSISKISNSNTKIIRKNYTKHNSKTNLNLNQTIKKSFAVKDYKNTEFITTKKSKNSLLNKSINNYTNTNNNSKKTTILRGKKSDIPGINENSISMVDGSWKISEKMIII